MSRSGRPKFLLDIAGTGRSLLQAAFDRLTPLSGDRFMVVTGVSHVNSVRHQLPQIATENLLAEPSPRDSMAAIGLAAAVLESRDPDLIMGSFPADHVISDVGALHECVMQGHAAAQSGQLALIGLEPTRPTSALGYIRMGDSLDLPGASQARRIDAFVEKPSTETAAEFIGSGGYLWNAGMWIVRAGVLMELLASVKPDLAQALRTIATQPGITPELWETVERTTIDHAIAEPLAGTSKLCIVPGKFGWEDIGDFSALRSYLEERDPGVRFHSVLGGERVVGVDSTGVVVGSTGRTIAVVGMDNVVVVDTEDALLVMREDYAQELKRIHRLMVDVNPEIG